MNFYLTFQMKFLDLNPVITNKSAQINPSLGI